MSDTDTGRLQRILATPLMLFVVISIGFALGRMTAPASTTDVADATTDDASQVETAGAKTPTGPSRVYVTYLHGNMRCVTCNTIERLLRDTVHKRFAEALADGRVVWREVNYDEDPALAKRYDAATSMPVISWEVDGREAGFDKIDEVWSLMRDPVAFEDAIVDSIDTALERLPSTDADAAAQGGA